MNINNADTFGVPDVTSRPLFTLYVVPSFIVSICEATMEVQASEKHGAYLNKRSQRFHVSSKHCTVN